MKKTNYLSIILTLLIFASCKKTELLPAGEYELTNHDVLFIGELNSMHGFYQTKYDCLGTILNFENNNPVSLGDVKINDISIRNTNASSVKYPIKFNQENTIYINGVPSQQFPSVTTTMTFPIQLKVNSVNQKFNKDNYLTWAPVDANDNMLLTFESIGQLNEQDFTNGKQTYYNILIKDNGRYNFDDALDKVGNTNGVKVTLYRFTNQIVKSGKRAIEAYAYSAQSGVFYP